MDNKSNLTYLESIALKGEVAYAVSTSLHNADIKYRLYLMLMQAPDTMKEALISYVKELTSLPEEELEQVILETHSTSVPVWLWVEKCINDLKICTKSCEFVGAQGGRTDCDKQECKKAIVLSAFTKFLRQLALCSAEVSIALCREILTDNELSFLHPITYTLLEEIKDYALTRSKNIVPATIMSVVFDAKDIMSSLVESQAMEKIDELDLLILRTKQDENLEKLKKTSEELSAQVEELFQERKKEKFQYVVTKTYGSSHLTTALREFNSRKEAEEFLKDLEENFPELNKTCRFEIHKEKRE